MSRPSPEERPNAVPWPPLLLVMSIGAGIILHAMFPLSIPPSVLLRPLGALLIVVALGLDIWASITFRRAKTTILPHRGSDALVDSGPFAYSRNPIYVGNVLILIGVGFLGATYWPILLTPILVFAVQKLAIEREEAHLAARFGPQWDAYSAKVRRWL